jgi:hypothetical protein
LLDPLGGLPLLKWHRTAYRFADYLDLSRFGSGFLCPGRKLGGLSGGVLIGGGNADVDEGGHWDFLRSDLNFLKTVFH